MVHIFTLNIMLTSLAMHFTLNLTFPHDKKLCLLSHIRLLMTKTFSLHFNHSFLIT